MRASPSRRRPLFAVGLSVALTAGALSITPAAVAAPDGSNVVIKEVYGGGGNNGSTFTHDFIELYNPTDEPIELDGMSLQYRSAAGTGSAAPFPLEGTIPAEGHWLVQAAQGAGGTTPLPTPDQVSDFAMGASGGRVLLADTTDLIPVTTGDTSAIEGIVDFVGFGNATAFEGDDAAPAPSNTTSVTRNGAGLDTDQNNPDFTTGAPDPVSSGIEPEPAPPGIPATIAEIQGTGNTSPLEDARVTTQGVVTASYPTGGLAGFVIQTAGTGGPLPADHDGSLAVFVGLTGPAGEYPAIGDSVEVTGTVVEDFGLTTITATTDEVVELAEALAPVTPTETGFPTTNARRERLESMLLAPTGRFTVTDNFGLNRFAEIGLAAGTDVLRQPTDVGRPGSGAAAAAEGQIAARALTLDDGSSIDYLSGANRNIPLPWLTAGDPIRVGAEATITRPVIFDFQFGDWRFQPTEQLTAANDASVRTATFEDTRTAAPENVGGDVTLATFNVLNYFVELGSLQDRSFNAATPPAIVDTPNGTIDCTSFADRQGNGIGTRGTVTGEPVCLPRGAWDQASFDRQEAKIVAAINDLDADVVSLEEIENSAKFGEDRDTALDTLVAALNADAGAEKWAAVDSAPSLPALSDEDVIRNAFIYQVDAVEPVGASKVLVGSAAFGNAREPLAQVFQPVGGAYNQAFLAVVNHFKSKSPADPPLPADHPSGNGDAGDGQGAFNGDRVRQSEALLDFVDLVKEGTGVEKVFLTGDFNAYTQEDPMQVLYDAGYVSLGDAFTDESTYTFGGLVGSLDHVLANQAAAGSVVDADIWNINSVEPISLEYSRFNYNVTDFYDESPYRSSDHDPILVGFDVPAPDYDTEFLNLIDINDFHGRIDANTVKFAGTVEQLRAEYGEERSAFVSAGDNIGASVFASSLAQDQPTIDVLNALDLLMSAVGNHEFDAGFDDLINRVVPASDFPILGANVYDEDTGEPVLEEFASFPVDGRDVCMVGTVTQETPALVSASAVEGLEFGDPVEATNRVVDEIAAACDVIIASYHAGAAEGLVEGATLEEEIADSPTFAAIVNDTSAEVDVIFTGHTHKQYAWRAPVPGQPGKDRAVVQTGNYGEFVGQVVLAFDEAGEISTHALGNVRRSTTADSVLVAAYPRVAEVKTIVDAAIAEADIIGLTEVATLDEEADITTAFGGGTYGPEGYQGGTRDQRALESTLGNTVANALRDEMSDPDRGGAEIALVNPGGLRADLLYDANPNVATDEDGSINFAEANAVLPFLNDIWTLTLTGAQLKAVLEEQWQTNPDGTIPSRPFLHLGLSDNVSTTLDPTAPRGERVTSIRIDGEPMDPEAEYRIATFSFLATGGDNFRSFTEATEVAESGLLDRDVWIAWLEKNSPNVATYDRRQVYEVGAPEAIAAGETVEFTLGIAGNGATGQTLDLTSLGSPANTTVEAAMVDGQTVTDLGEFPVAGGISTVSITAPATVPAGAVFTFTAQPSGTTVTIPGTAAVVPPTASEVDATVSPARVEVKKTEAVVTATVTAGGVAADGGTVEVRLGESVVGTGQVVAGTASITLPVFDTLGDRTFEVAYLGTDTAEPSSTELTVTVVKATPSMEVEVKPATIKAGKTKAKLKIALTAPGQTVSGFVAVKRKGEILALVVLQNGKATAKLPAFPKKGKKKVNVVYLGGDLTTKVSAKVTIKVAK